VPTTLRHSDWEFSELFGLTAIPLTFSGDPKTQGRSSLSTMPNATFSACHRIRKDGRGAVALASRDVDLVAGEWRVGEEFVQSQLRCQRQQLLISLRRLHYLSANGEQDSRQTPDT
jgi:hypothetical protein